MIDVIAKVREAKAKKIQLWPCKSNRASESGHPCTRYLVYNQANWKDRIPTTVELQFIFDQGNDMHDRAMEDLREAGFRVHEQDRPFEWKEYNITGKIDCQISEDGHILYPCEIKSMSEWDWAKIDSAEDMILSPKAWIRKYPAQLVLYLLMSNSPEGLFYIINKRNGQPKQIWMQLQDATDYEFAEKIIKNIEQVNKHLKEGTYPERIEYEENLCGHCNFQHICLPDIKNQSGLQIIDSEELLGYLTRLDELKSATSEYKKIDDKVKDMIRGKDKLLCGDFLITGKEITIQKKAQEARTETQWRAKIVNLNAEKLKERAQKED